MRRKNSFLIIIIGIVFLFVLCFFLFRSGPAPQNVLISNQTNTSLTISWITEKPTGGVIILSSEKNRVLRTMKFLLCGYFSYKCNVSRDQISYPSTVHYVEINDLSSTSLYYYRLLSGRRLFKFDNKGTILPPLATAPLSENLVLPVPVFSYIYSRADGKTPVAGALVYLTLLDKQKPTTPLSSTLTTFTDQAGLWIANLGNLRTVDLTNSMEIKKGDQLLISIVSLDKTKLEKFVDFEATQLEPIILKTN